MRKAIVLLSGGIDSTVCAYLAKQQGYTLFPLAFNYKQSHVSELDAAGEICEQLGVTLKTISLELLGNSLLTTGIGNNAFVPARNTIFLAYAMGYAEAIGVTEVFFGANAADNAGFPDCRPDYLRAFEKMAALGSQGRGIQIHTPLLHLQKSDIIRLGNTLGVDFSKTVTCYHGNHCGECLSCIIRKKAFTEIGITDPLQYKS
jgi:7-cyano-7-deazaguanine synthase